MHLIENVLITGGSSFLGHHVIKHLELYMPNLKSIRILDEVKFVKTLDYESKIPVEFFEGTVSCKELLTDALFGVQAVFHLYEYKSYAMITDQEKFNKVNVEDTKLLLDICKTVGTVKYFIFGSGIEVMISRKIHTVNHPESGRIPFHQLAFPDYAKSKLAAEELVLAEDDFQTFIVRLGPMYGELDTNSWVMGRLRQASKHNGVMQVWGDRENVFQHTYVGNVAYGLVCVLQKMFNDRTVTKEITFLLDDTPLLEMFKNIEPFLKARNYHLSKTAVPFYPVFLPYCAVEMVVKMLNKLIDIRPYVEKWPSSAYFFTYFYNWIFFKRVKCRIFVDYKPLYSFQQSINASVPYYANVDL
jgi:nucleoside-diphosphate-sugar epimerase